MLPSTDALARIAVLLILAGLTLVGGVLITINALMVGFHMLGALLITVGFAFYLIAVVGDLRRRKAL